MLTTSVVVPAFNGERFIAASVEGVLAQTNADWELVLVDDGSTDGTQAIAQSYAESDPRIRVVRQCNHGVAAARNRGLAESQRSSEYIIFLDQDDVWESDALQRLVNVLKACPSAAAASGLSRIIDDGGEPVAPGQLESWGRQREGMAGRRVVPWPVEAPTTLAVLAYGNCIYTPGQVLIRRSAMEKAGAFDESLSPCDDWDMWLRLSLVGTIALLDRVVLNWRAHSNNGSAGRRAIFEGHARIRRKMLSSPAVTPEQRWLIVLANWLWAREVRRMRLDRARGLLLGGEPWLAARQVGLILSNYAHSLRGIPVAAPLLSPSPRELYRAARSTPSDINEHLDTLYGLARRCQHVTEFGTRWGMSTTALLAARPRVLVSYDRDRPTRIGVLEEAAAMSGATRFVFRQADVLEVEIEDTDMLFIDTWHVYEQLRRELMIHASKARKYLVFHDTSTYGETGEAEGSRGLWPAIEEFLEENPQWHLAARLANNNGLTVLRRQGEPARLAP